MSNQLPKGPADAFGGDSSKHSSSFICWCGSAERFYSSLLMKTGILTDFPQFSFWLRKKIFLVLNQELKVSSAKTHASPKWL